MIRNKYTKKRLFQESRYINEHGLRERCLPIYKTNQIAFGWESHKYAQCYSFNESGFSFSILFSSRVRDLFKIYFLLYSLNNIHERHLSLFITLSTLSFSVCAHILQAAFLYTPKITLILCLRIIKYSQAQLTRIIFSQTVRTITYINTTTTRRKF